MKYSKTFRILAVALTLALFAATLPATPALAQYLELTPNQRKIGERVDFYVNYLTGSAQVSLYFSDTAADVGKRIDTDVLNYTRVVPSAYANPSSGEISGPGAFFLVPSTLTDGAVQKTVRPGTYYVYITYYGLKPIVARASFTVKSTGVITLDPAAGAVATEVKITGSGFADKEDIKIKYDGASVAIQNGANSTSSNGTFTCTIIIPESTAGAHTITVTGKDFGAEAAFTTAPKITITPASGIAGDRVTVNGTGLGDGVDFNVFFDDVAVVANKVTSRQGSFGVIFVVPPKASASYDVKVQDENGNTDKVKFTIAVSAISLSPASGYTSDNVTVSGSSFKANQPITIIFDNENMPSTTSTNATGEFTTTFTVPVRTTGTYAVKASDGPNTAQASFTIGTGATISPATTTAAPGHVGTEVTISGVGFSAGRTVTVTYDGKQVVTAMVNPNGTFSSTFNAPASSSGQHSISATDGTNTQPLTFVMEATPPATVYPQLPLMNSKLEKWRFDWSGDATDLTKEVNDPSGVTYTLQIATQNATNEVFPAGSIVLERTGISTSEYTLTKEERLKSASKDAPYYWRVKAVDGASNEKLSGIGAFYVSGFTFGLFQGQGMRYTLFGIGALILFIVGFWLGRRTAYY